MYLVLPKGDWDHRTELVNVPGVQHVPLGQLIDRVEALTGRAHVLAYASVNRKLRDGKRIYVAGHTPILVQKERI